MAEGFCDGIRYLKWSVLFLVILLVASTKAFRLTLAGVLGSTGAFDLTGAFRLTMVVGTEYCLLM